MGLNYTNDHFYTHTFTPPEYQVELITRIKDTNTIICSSTTVSKSFIAIKLIQELSHQMREPDGKRAFYILDAQNTNVLSSQINLLTDLPVKTITSSITLEEWKDLKQENVIFLMAAETLQHLLTLLNYNTPFLNVIIIDDCFYGDRQKHLSHIMTMFEHPQAPKPRIIGLVSGFLSDELIPAHLEAEMHRLEALLHAKVDTSSELCTLVKLSCEPRECIVEFTNKTIPTAAELFKLIDDEINQLEEFLLDQNYDLCMLYGEECGELTEELKNIPDPKILPLQMIKQFRNILEEYGIMCANYAALHILHQIEKLRVKVAYERHYLLLLSVQTLMIKVRAHIDYVIEEMNEIDALKSFSTGKVERLIEILRVLGPDQPKPTPEEIEKKLEVKSLAPIKGRRYPRANRRFFNRPQQDDSICALIFVRDSLTAKVVHSLLAAVGNGDDKMWWLGVQFIVDKIADPATEIREAELEHRRQEEVLRKFRAHECNILIATPILEQGYDLPKCNLVVKLNTPESFHSYVFTKARARTSTSHYISLVHNDETLRTLRKFAEFKEVQKLLLSRCGQVESNTTNVIYSDLYCNRYKPYVTPKDEVLSVNSAIQLINRYCAKLPSDAFTKLVPAYHTKCINGDYRCYLRLPINSPVKLTVEGPLAPSEIVAKKLTAFHMCQLLHKSNELDDHLNPITKESFRATEEDWNDFTLEKEDEELSLENIEQRPGTTKRRQYYFKNVASALRICLPTREHPTFLYHIVMTLTCPIPEEQNTRGRRIYPPEESPQGFGLLTSKEIPPICPFPIFTRSGEVNVALELCDEDLMLTDEEISRIREFQNYTFTSVLRLQKYQMHFDPEHSLSNYFVVPTITENCETKVDWDFLNVIYDKRYDLPQHIPDDDRKNYVFDAQQYKDAVVMPWYRNQDQPQYFYVAEICKHLSPSSAFPGSEYNTFRDYYFKKYDINIQNNEQQLLDVDHTSARLNFLTPRYVNRKGVALPTSSEETKRAKRENLEQKQILVPELCAIHPFSASLWRKAVCLPCILYRVNALLISDQIRCIVAREIKLGRETLDRNFTWDALNFGWSLSDVLGKTKSGCKSIKMREEVTEIIDDIIEKATNMNTSTSPVKGEENNENDPDWMEIGTWSNDMIGDAGNNSELVRYGSPTWNDNYDYNNYSDSDSFSSTDDETGDSQYGGLHIKFQDDYQAEAVEDIVKEEEPTMEIVQAWTNSDYEVPQVYESRFQSAVQIRYDRLIQYNYIKCDEPFKKGGGHIDAMLKPIAEPFLIEEYEYKPIKIRHSAINTEKINETIIEIEEISAFSFDSQPDLKNHPGPSPSLILQALTMSNANDGINLERLETIGDSFLKYAITDYLYTRYENTHEGKLSHLRSKQVSNLNLYRLGKRKQLGMMMIASKFDPHDNWLPPCYCVSKELEEILSLSKIPGSYLTLAEYVETRHMTLEELCTKFRNQAEDPEVEDPVITGAIPYNLVTQHSIPDKSIADCVEALIGAYLIECGPRGALLFMAWLGIRVLPKLQDGGYGELCIPDSPLLRHVSDPFGILNTLLDGYEKFERILGYSFHDRAYLLQSLTHASYSPNTITDCYQRLEFLGDAVLDYLITRHLFEDQRMHSPGALTDLRSALVNNTIFASLAVKFEFHKYFRYLSPGLHHVIEKFIRMQEEAGHKVSDDLYLLDVEDSEEVEDVEVPKVLGDVFESVAGAIFLDSGRSLDAVWSVYYRMMKNEIEQFSNKVPKSPIRELLELEPETAKFGRAEKLADGRRVRVSVEVFGKGTFKGIGRNYRIAKCTAAKCALKHLKKLTK